MGLSKTDKIKVRTATKCYLLSRNDATAREIFHYILSCDLKITSHFTVNVLAKDLKYCGNTTSRNILTGITYEFDNTNTIHYSLPRR